jgi:hypothetical protein
MPGPTSEDIDSEFVVLDEDYDDADFYGGAFEGSHTYAGIVVFHLYSIIPAGDGKQLRIETRHHGDGRVLTHDREERSLSEYLTVDDTGTPVRSFCRQHHERGATEEIRSVIDQLDAELAD